MTFVIDASVTACWLFDDEDHPLATEAMGRLARETARAPAVWWFEVRNALIVAERRRRVQPVSASRYLSLLSGLPIVLDHDPVEHELLAIARRHELTVYDAAYLELARRLSAPLATLDGRLARAAAAEGVSAD